MVARCSNLQDIYQAIDIRDRRTFQRDPQISITNTFYLCIKIRREPIEGVHQTETKILRMESDLFQGLLHIEVGLVGVLQYSARNAWMQKA